MLLLFFFITHTKQTKHSFKNVYAIKCSRLESMLIPASFTFLRFSCFFFSLFFCLQILCRLLVLKRNKTFSAQQCKLLFIVLKLAVSKKRLDVCSVLCSIYFDTVNELNAKQANFDAIKIVPITLFEVPQIFLF